MTLWYLGFPTKPRCLLLGLICNSSSSASRWTLACPVLGAEMPFYLPLLPWGLIQSYGFKYHPYNDDFQGRSLVQVSPLISSQLSKGLGDISTSMPNRDLKLNVSKQSSWFSHPKLAPLPGFCVSEMALSWTQFLSQNLQFILNLFLSSPLTSNYQVQQSNPIEYLKCIHLSSLPFPLPQPKTHLSLNWPYTIAS